MGESFMGKSGTESMLLPEQQQFFKGALGGGLGEQAGQMFQQYLQPQSQDDLQSAFQKGVVDPQLKTYQQDILPAIQERFVGQNASSSSAMNQALARSAEDFTTSLGGQYLPFMQGQQQNQLTAAGQAGGLAQQQTFQPFQKQGYGPDLMSALGEALKGLFSMFGK